MTSHAVFPFNILEAFTMMRIAFFNDHHNGKLTIERILLVPLNVQRCTVHVRRAMQEQYYRSYVERT